MNCEELIAVLNEGGRCQATPDGLRLLTDCLYPSFERVAVYVSGFGDGYRVSDAGGACTVAFRHGRDESAMQGALKNACLRHSLAMKNGMLLAEVPSVDWLRSAVLAVANGSAMAASAAVEHMAVAQENALRSRMLKELEQIAPPGALADGYEYRGSSGKIWPVDFAILKRERPILIKSITPNHVSISTNYTAFSDIGADDNVPRLSVHDKPLRTEDAALIRQVADLLPLTALREGARRAMARAT